MRWDEMYLVGAGVSLPSEVAVGSAIRDGLYDAPEVDRMQHLAVTFAEAGRR